MKRNKINMFIGAVTFRLHYYFLKNKERNFLLTFASLKGRRFLFEFFIRELIREIQVYLNYFFKKINPQIAKFVFFAQGGVGGSLLGELLASHPQVQYDDEILALNTLFPNLYIKAKCALSAKKVYGFKIKIYHLADEQNIRDPKEFMRELHRQGWKIIYIKRRNILDQEITMLKKKIRFERQFKPKDVPSRGDKKYHIDCKDLIEGMNRRETYLAQEEEVLENLPHITVVFEDDLLRAENHQRTIDKIFDYLGLSFVAVKKVFVKAAFERPLDSIQNYEEVIQAVRQARYDKFLKY